MTGWPGKIVPEPKILRDMEEARGEPRKVSRNEMNKWSQEKAKEILREQRDGAPARAEAPGALVPEACSNICGAPVEAIMSTRVATLSLDDNLLVVQNIFAGVKFRHLPVVDESRRIIGIISDRDFLRTVSPFFGTINEQKRDQEIMTRKIGTIMTRNPVCSGRKTTVIEAVKLMDGGKISCLPIVEDDGTLAGIVTWKDVVRAFCPTGFARAGGGARLRADPEADEETRFTARPAEGARPRARHSVGEEAPTASERLAARVRASVEAEERAAASGEGDAPNGESD